MDIENPNLDDLLQLWRSRRPGSRLPARSHFGIADFRPFLGHIFIGCVIRDPLRIRADLIGTEIVSRVDGRDLTGRLLEDHLPEHARDFVLSPIYKAIETASPVYDRASTGQYSPLLMQRIILPLAEDGQTVDRVLGAIYTTGSMFDRLMGTFLEKVKAQGRLFQRTDLIEDGTSKG